MYILHDSKEIQFRHLENFDSFRVISKDFVPVQLHEVEMPQKRHLGMENVNFRCEGPECVLCKVNSTIKYKAMIVQDWGSKELFVTLVPNMAEIQMVQEANVKKINKLAGKVFFLDETTEVPGWELLPTRVYQLPLVSRGWQHAVTKMIEDFIPLPSDVMTSKINRDLEEQEQQAQLEEVENVERESMQTFVVNRHAERFPTGYRNRKPDRHDKGKLGGACNVNACQLEGQAVFYNRAMRAHYCYQCAYDIHSANRDSQLYDPNIFQLCQDQSYTLTREQAEEQRKLKWYDETTVSY